MAIPQALGTNLFMLTLERNGLDMYAWLGRLVREEFNSMGTRQTITCDHVSWVRFNDNKLYEALSAGAATFDKVDPLPVNDEVSIIPSSLTMICTWPFALPAGNV